MVFKGPKTPEVMEQEMFSLLNMIIKRDYYTKEKQESMKIELKNIMRQYLD